MSDSSERIYERFFESMSPLRLRTFSVKEKNKAIIAERIAMEFEYDRKYTEFDVNAILAPICPDHATVRRYLVDSHLLGRTKDCKEYWREKKETE